MDGLEWKRSKYNKGVQKFLKYAEKLAVNNSHFLISDSIGIQDYVKNKYKVDSEYIPYGAEMFNSPDSALLEELSLEAYNYNMLIARLEPENNIETILAGVTASSSTHPTLVIGKHNTSYGNYLKQKFGLTGEIWSPRMMGTPKGSNPKVTHNYYALYGKLPPRSVKKGSVPMNLGDHPEYDPAVIAKLKSMRGSSSKDVSTPTDRTSPY